MYTQLESMATYEVVDVLRFMFDFPPVLWFVAAYYVSNDDPWLPELADEGSWDGSREGNNL